MRILVISIIIILLDQASKLLVKAKFAIGESVSVLGEFLRLTYIENPGMAFGIRFAGRWFFTIFSLIASLILIFYIIKLRRERLMVRFPLALILGGAIGNLIDRFLYGQVVDFIEVSVGSYRWPVFNAADSAVTVGMIMLIALLIFEKEERQIDNSTIELDQPNPADSEERDIWQTR